MRIVEVVKFCVGFVSFEEGFSRGGKAEKDALPYPAGGYWKVFGRFLARMGEFSVEILSNIFEGSFDIKKKPLNVIFKDLCHKNILLM